MLLQGDYKKGDMVEIFCGTHKPKAGGGRQYATVMRLAGTKMIDIVLEKAGRPRTTIMLTSVRPVGDGSRIGGKAGVKAVNSPPKKGVACTTCGDCAGCKLLKQEIGILAKALSDICSLRQGGDEFVSSGPQ
jgi:hypothetical protein